MFTTASAASYPSADSQRSVDGLDFSDHPHVVSRLMRRAALEFRAARRPATMAALAQLTEPANQSRMVFIVGAARSGTTAIQRALNSSPDVFMLDEAYLFWENLRSGFRARYNEKHRAWGRPIDKDNDCPAVAPEDGTWVETIAALARQYRLVGEKVAITAYRAGRWPSEFLAFHRRHFHGAAYILMFRNPRDAILSPGLNWGIKNLVPWARSYIAAQRALIRLRLNFPRTVPVFLETAGPDTFAAIEQCLDCSLPRLATVFVPKEESPSNLELGLPQLRQTVGRLEALYPALRESVLQARVSRSDGSLDAIEGRLAELYHQLDPLYYSIGARLARIRSRVVTASRMARSLLSPH